MCVTPSEVAKIEGYIQSPINRRGELRCTFILTGLLPGSWLELFITDKNWNLYLNCQLRGAGQHNFFSVSQHETTRCRPRTYIRYQVMSTEAEILFYSNDFKEDHMFLLRYRG